MKIKLLSLKLKNFKGLASFEASFNGKNCTVEGDNGTGKTTLFDAFLWVLFGKDSQGKADFAVKPLNSDGSPVHNVDVEVEAVLAIDDKEKLSLKKVMKEKWTKKRGEPIPTFSGHTFQYFIDGIPVKKKEWQARISELVDEEVFRLVTNPFYFPQLHWEKRRQILMNVCGGDVKDEEILASDERLTSLFEILSNRTVSDHLKWIKSRQKEINKRLKEIPVRIDELYKLLPQECLEKETLEQLSSLSEEKNKLMLENLNGTTPLDILLQQKESILQQINTTETLIDRLREKFHSLSTQLKNPICPTCGQTIPEEKVDIVFSSIKQEKEQIKKEGMKYKEHISSLKERLIEINTKMEEAEKGERDRKQVEERINKIDKQIDELKATLYQVEQANKNNNRIQELQSEQKKLLKEHEKLQQELFLCEEFTKKKVELIEDRINSMFKLAKFKLFKQNINGGIEECCEIIYKGVPFDKGLNKGMQINVGLDILNTLSKHYDFYAPVFIDNAEAVTNLLSVDTQVIRLVVKEGIKTLNIT